MATNRDFFFSLLKVSMVQLLKAQGFDRAKSSTVDVVTDLYVRFLELLVSEIKRLAALRGEMEEAIALQDITLGLQNLGVIKPMDVLDVYDENPELAGDAGLQKFKDWCVDSVQTNDERIMAIPTVETLKNELQSNNKPLSLIPEYINQIQNRQEGETAKGKNNNNGEVDETEKFMAELINNGYIDDWIRLVQAKQRISLAKKISNKDPHDIAALPALTGLKYTILQTTPTVTNEIYPTPTSQHQTSDVDDKQLPSHIEKGLRLMNHLPIMHPENSISNITLTTLEEEEEEEAPIEEHEPEQESWDSNIGSFALGNPDISEYDELQDLDNTFQRRDSIDFSE